MMEDSTLHHVYNTPWALPCTVLSRSWSILRDFIEAGSDLGSVSHDSTLTTDPGSLTRSDEGPRHVQSVLHAQLRRPSEDRPSLLSILSLTSESNSCRPTACHSDDCERCTSLWGREGGRGSEGGRGGGFGRTPPPPSAPLWSPPKGGRKF